MNMSVIPNVYQAAYMEGLTKRNNAQNAGVFGNRNFTETDLQKVYSFGKFIGVSMFSNYTVETSDNNDPTKGAYYIAKTQEGVANILTQELKKEVFPPNSVGFMKQNRYEKKANPQPITNQSFSGFMKKSATRNYKERTLHTDR